MDLLPDDLLAEVLRRVPLRRLAACRCVCGAWRAAVDGLGLLGAHVLPHSLTGIFINYFDYERPRFFARRPTSPQIDATLDFTPDRSWRELEDHCNGLLLCEDRNRSYVCNPATRRWALLPQPGGPWRPIAAAYLAFDPAASLHYDVIWFPDPDVPYETPEPSKNLEDEEKQRAPKRQKRHLSPVPADVQSLEEEVRDPEALMEWPPSLFKMNVFLSRTWRWEEREFVREGDAVVTLADARLDSYEPTYYHWQGPRRRYAVYWRGALYVHCRGDYVTKLFLSDDKYQVIKIPRNIEEGEYTKSYLGGSEKGVNYTTLDKYQLWVWALDESSGPMEWILKYHVDLKPLSRRIQTLRHIRNEPAWILDDDSEDKDNNDENLEWNSDDDYILDIEHSDMDNFCSNLFLPGFHPYKEVVFLGISISAVACHLRHSKAQYLGSLWPNGLHVEKTVGVHESFPYTPCLIDLLPGKDN